MSAGAVRANGDPREGWEGVGRVEGSRDGEVTGVTMGVMMGSDGSGARAAETECEKFGTQGCSKEPVCASFRVCDLPNL
jgi:hypothetical protein